MNTSPAESSSAPLTETPEEISRRRFFEKLSIALVGLCTAIVGVPLIGFIVAPFFRKVPREWVTLGKPDDFQIGKTVAVTVTDPSSLPWAGVTAKSGVWLRRVTPTTSSRFQLTARISGVLCAGWKTPTFSCVHAMVASITMMATSPPVRRRSLSFAMMCGSQMAKCK